VMLQRTRLGGSHTIVSDDNGDVSSAKRVKL